MCSVKAVSSVRSVREVHPVSSVISVSVLLEYSVLSVFGVVAVFSDRAERFGSAAFCNFPCGMLFVFEVGRIFAKQRNDIDFRLKVFRYYC